MGGLQWARSAGTQACSHSPELLRNPAPPLVRRPLIVD
ncbi:unnamed protein product [Amoebophrya sp. A25]|nr:unnamed protein product [Amoebophrya sp. A25]|eukprot:GSA25T00020167001.1